ncbi:MAG: Hsp20/alpha crystallin family protein [Chitinophagaceae bacterium]
MENRAVDKPKTSWPSFFDNGWMDKFFNAPLDEFFNYGKVLNVPAVNVTETDKDFRLCIAAPGLEKKDFKIDAYDDMLTISAEHEKEQKEEKDGRFNRREYNYSSWSRSFTLPENCDFGKIDAEYKNGELKLVVPKIEVKEPKKMKTITVN